MTSTKITPAKAQATLKAIIAQFSAYTQDSEGKPNLAADLPVLVEHDDHWEIVWECGSPFEWALRAFEGGIDEEMTSMIREFDPAAKPVTTKAIACPKGVYAEPVMSFILGLYKD